MTIAISLKVNDGVVLAADSASTLVRQTPTGTGVVQVFNNANKIFNLRKGLPIGLITWGTGSIGLAATSTLIKDLRVRLTSPDPAHTEWHIDPKSYTIESVAGLVRRFLYEEHYKKAFATWQGNKPTVGFIVAGYSSDGSMAEEYMISVDAAGECGPPQLQRKLEECGVAWNGEPEAIARLLLGYGTGLPKVLEQRLGVTGNDLQTSMQLISQSLRAEVIYNAMPIQDAIDLAEFLADMTEKFSRYTPGAATVGGPIEVAAITKHEGFRWVKRKFYYPQELNPDFPKADE